MVRLRRLYPHLTKRKTRLLLRSPHYHIRLAAVKANVHPRHYNRKYRHGNIALHLDSVRHKIANHIVLSHMQGLPWETYMNRHHHDFTS